MHYFLHLSYPCFHLFSFCPRLLDMVRDCFGIAVAKNVDDIKPDHLPVILIVYKAKGQVEVRNIIQGER